MGFEGTIGEATKAAFRAIRFTADEEYSETRINIAD